MFVVVILSNMIDNVVTRVRVVIIKDGVVSMDLVMIRLRIMMRVRVRRW